MRVCLSNARVFARPCIALAAILLSTCGNGDGEVAMCKACTIELTEIAILGNSEGPGSFELPPNGRAWDIDSDQRFWIGNGTQLLIFDRRGQFVQQVGRAGEGPGEFRGISRVLCVPGDSVLVLDVRLGRASVFDSSGRYIRNIRMMDRAQAFDIAVLRWPTDIIMNAVVLEETSVGWPLHVLDFSGPETTLKRSFGDNDGRYVFGQELKLQRMIGLGGKTDFWTAPLYTLALKHWSVDGQELSHSFSLQPDWLSQEAEPLPLGTPSTPPARLIRALWVDPERDLVWTVAWIPRRDWAEAWKTIKPLPGQGEVRPSDLPAPEELWETRIDVFNPRAPRSITNATMPILFERLSSAGFAAIPAEARDGTPRLRMIRLEMTDHVAGSLDPS